jgi:hypothetical protein
MENNDQHHEVLIKEIAEQYADVLNTSKQAMYIYLDDDNKVCNARFATLLGYPSKDEWARTKGPFAQMFVTEPSQETLVRAYNDAMQDKVSSTVPVNWKKKNGETVSTEVNLVPLAYCDHLFALHFID